MRQAQAQKGPCVCGPMHALYNLVFEQLLACKGEIDSDALDPVV